MATFSTVKNLESQAERAARVEKRRLLEEPVPLTDFAPMSSYFDRIEKGDLGVTRRGGGEPLDDSGTEDPEQAAWTHVSERLPAPDEWVLVYQDDRDNAQDEFIATKVFGAPHGRREVAPARLLFIDHEGYADWYLCMVGGGPLRTTRNVTHWRPLPAPPASLPVSVRSGPPSTSEPDRPNGFLSTHGRALLSITQAMHACEVLPHDDAGKLADCLALLDEAGSALDSWYAPENAA